MTFRLPRFLRSAAARERELDEEMRFHLDMEAADLVKQGLAPDAARRQARRTFGNAFDVRDATRTTAPFHRVEALAQDVRLAPRLLWRSPLLSVTIVLTLALGIGVTGGVFAVLDAMLLRPRVTRDPDTFVQFAPAYRDSVERRTDFGPVPLDDYRAYRSAATSLRGLAAWSPAHVRLGRVEPRQTLAVLASCEFFPLYGARRAMVGRLFVRDECETPRGGPVVLLGEALWRESFDADPAIVGRAVTVNGAAFTVVGVLPAAFSGRLRGPGIWIPYSMQPLFFGGPDLFRDGAPAWLTVEGRLAPGRTLAQAEAEVRVVARRLDALHEGRVTAVRLTHGALVDDPTPAVRRAVVWVTPLVMGVVLLPLVVVCANVTTLLLARAVARRRETAVRLALGAGLGRLLRMMLAESVLLATVGGAFGVALLYGVPGLLRRALFSSDTPYFDFTPHAVSFVLLVAVALGAGLLAGWAPAAESARLSLTAALKGEEAGRTLGALGARRRWGVREILIGVQVAVSTVLLTAAVLFVRAERAIAAADHGYETRRVMLLPLDDAGSADDAAVARAHLALVDGARRVAGVDGVALATSFVGDEGEGEEVRVPGAPRGTGRRASWSGVSPEFFDVMHIPLARGRTFTRLAVGAPRPAEAIVSQSLARALWPHADPLGARVDDGEGGTLEVVGVARDVIPTLGGDPAQLYVPRGPAARGGMLLAHFTGDERATAHALGAAALRVDPTQAVLPRTVQSVLDAQAELFWHVARLVVGLAALAVALALVGIYGVVAFAVSRRMREMGIRTALGASRVRLALSVADSAVRPIVAGLVAGALLAVVGAVALAQAFAGAPIALAEADPVSHVTALALVVLVAAAAMGVPAMRATRADPMRALRQE